ANGVKQIRAVMDTHRLAGVRIAADKKPALESLPGPAKRELIEQGWRVFLVKVLNEAGTEGVELRAESPNAAPLHIRSSSSPAPKVASTEAVTSRFPDLEMFSKQPVPAHLAGLASEN